MAPIPSVVSNAAMLLYDTLLCFTGEVKLVWTRTTSLASALYIINRYIPLIGNLLGTAMINPISNTVSHQPRALPPAIAEHSRNVDESFATMRMYALSGRSRLLCGTTLVLSFVPFFVNLSSILHLKLVNHGPPVNCAPYYSQATSTYHMLILVNRTSTIVADSLVIAVTLHQTYRSIRLAQDAPKRPSLHRVLLQSGCIYLGALVSLNLLQIVLSVVGGVININTNASYVTAFIDPISSVLNSRFLLNLRETNEKLTAGGSSISQGSLWFAVPNLALSSTELPPFASSLAGPVHLRIDDEPETVEDADGETVHDDEHRVE
ncbi:hypothetical protein BV20DRAFT_1006572 [Pilatotrama ljubarskyi]|nr:hypothetical protein BV20DRAFT_1006572 [Pilatotrama ljubarskyi]